jgi:hypothetical protein
MHEDQRRPAQLSVRLEADLRDVVEQRARRERRSVSNYLASLIADAVTGSDSRSAA